MEYGATGIVATRTQTPEEAEQIIQAVKYPPRGVRGMGPTDRTCGYGLAVPEMQDHRTAANRESYIIVVLESREAADRIDAFLAMPEIDSVHFGLVDMSIDMGYAGNAASPEVRALAGMLWEKTRKAGKINAYAAGNAEACRKLMAGEEPCIINIGSDIGLLRNALKPYFG